MINPFTFKALDIFDNELSGNTFDAQIRPVINQVFSDFSSMSERSIRQYFAGSLTEPSGADTVEIYGYINFLKHFDASVQWSLFMPELVKMQQNGFKLENFECKKMPVLRFIGREGEELGDIEVRKQLFETLDKMSEYNSEFSYDIFLVHHYGLGVDVDPGHGVWGRFMKADTPVPEGFLYLDFVPEHNGKPGLPYLSQFAYATFSDDIEAMHKCEGYDCNAMYDVTRNIMLGHGIMIPYPHKYWTAEVFLEGYDKFSTAFLFSAELFE